MARNGKSGEDFAGKGKRLAARRNPDEEDEHDKYLRELYREPEDCEGDGLPDDRSVGGPLHREVHDPANAHADPDEFNDDLDDDE